MNSSSAIPLVELRGITKVFPGVMANDQIDLELYRGEVHCLLGENGAGKSTLMQILAGMYRPDAGTIAIDGRIVDIASPKDAGALGVGMVYQHPTVVPTFTVLENLLLGSKEHFRLDRDQAAASLGRLAARLGTELDPHATVGRLPLGRQKQVEIVKVLWSGASIVILDEPTAMLTPGEVRDLVRVLASLREQRLAVVFITHKLREAEEVGDRITVLRQGRVVGTIAPDRPGGRPRRTNGRASAERDGMDGEGLDTRIVRMMFGDEAAALGEVIELERGGRPERAARALSSEVVLQLEGVSVKPGRQEVGLDAVSFAVRRGEIFGLAGIDGNGQRELAEAMAGQRPVARGRIRLGERDITRANVAERLELGLGFVTDDRLGEGTVPSMPISLNLLLKRIGEQPLWSRTRRISKRLVTEATTEIAEEFDIRAPDVDTPAGSLSGGNIQKLMLARELSLHPKIVVYNKPTQGLDLRTTLFVRERLRTLAEGDGVSAVLISTDLDELVQLCDRIGVMFRGRLVGVMDNVGSGIEERLGTLMVGGSEERN